MLVRVRLGDLRDLIRFHIVEAGGGTSHTGTMRNAVTMMSTADREAIDRQSKFDVHDDGEDLPPHLREPEEGAEEDWGPVPPSLDNDPYAMSDPLTKDYNVIPRPAIFSKFRG